MNIWSGKKVKLRAFESSDGEYNFLSWNNSENLKMRDVPKFPASGNVCSYFADKDSGNGPMDGDFHLIIENKNGDVVGDIGTDQLDQRNGTFTFGYEIEKKHRRLGYGSEAVLLVLRYYFYALRCNKAWTSVYSFNEASSKLLLKLGFKQEGIQREMVYLNGEYHDKLLFGMTFKEFDALYGQEYKI